MSLPVIECATLLDLPALSELLSTLFTQELEFAPNETAQHRGLTRIISNPDVGVILVAREGSGIVAMVNLLFTVSTALGEPVAILEDMVVTPSARHGGIGTALLNHAIELARNRGVKRITLLTDRDNHAAQRFYARHGFTESTMLPMRLSIG